MGINKIYIIHTQTHSRTPARAHTYTHTHTHTHTYTCIDTRVRDCIYVCVNM